MPDPLITLDEVTFRYDPERPVLRGASLGLRPGERVGLVGANGSGKTTLLHSIVGLVRPHGGRVVAFGRERREEADFREVRRRAGLLFQDPDDQLFCATVEEDVAFGPLNLGRGREEARRIAAETLDSLGLAGYGPRITHHLSGGEKRLVSLAAVLAMEPEVLLLDEPVAGLDEATEERLTDLLLTLPQAMLIVSHDAAFLARTSTRGAVLRNGRIEATSSRSRGRA